MVRIEKDIASISSLTRSVMPLMFKMIDALDNFVELDVPFLINERRQRIAGLRNLMNNPDASPAEKYRKISEAYEIENEYGRKRLKSGEYISRIIDIDIIFYEDLIINQNGLVIPHPRMQSRHFVLTPMCDLNPDFIHPVLGLKTSQLLHELEIRGDIVDINFSLED